MVPNNKAIKKLHTTRRLKVAHLPTPLEELDAISRRFKGARIMMKRDDLTGHSFGGNKERKLEFIMADVLQKKATTAVTIGTIHSNHCRLTTAFCSKLGIKTELILIKENGRLKRAGNYFLDALLGAKIHTVSVKRVGEKIQSVLRGLRKRGEKPYFIEGGGHNVLGVVGYVNALKEIKQQAEKMNIKPDYVVVPVGTGTTQAGLILGAALFNFDVKIIGISVGRRKKRCLDEISAVIKPTERYLGFRNISRNNRICVYDDYIGKGYGIPTKASVKTIQLLAETQGALIDPIYNAKAFAGMLDLISKKILRGTIVYLNTGGLPNLLVQRYMKLKA